MTAFNPIGTMKRLETAGIKRQHAEALADELRGAIDTVVTTEQLEAAMTRLTFRLAAIVGAMMAVGFSTLGVIIALHK